MKRNKVTYSLEQAAQKGRRVIIETKTNEILEFQRIVYKEGIFYGIQRVNGKKVRVILQEDKINSIREVDSSSTVLIFLGVIIGRSAIAMALDGGIMN